MIRRCDGAVISIYVDDLLIAHAKLVGIKDVKAMLCGEFNMTDLGEARTVIGIRIIRDRKAKTVTLDQEVYIRDMLKEEGSYIRLDEPGEDEDTDLGNT